MADILIKITVNPNVESEIITGIVNEESGSGSNANVANTSYVAGLNGSFSLPESWGTPTNGLLLKSENGSNTYDLIFDDDDYLDNQDEQGGVVEDETSGDQFIWGVVPSNNEYDVELLIQGSNKLKDIIIYGNANVGQFPTEAIIDNTTTIFNDSNEWLINFGSEASTHTIKLKKWNLANYSACITQINVTYKYYDVMGGQIDSINSKSQSSFGQNSIQYGVVPNSADGTIIDYNKQIYKLIRNGVIESSNMPIELYVNGAKVQYHITTDGDYDAASTTFTLQATDPLAKWEERTYHGKKIVEYSSSLYAILKNIMNTLGYTDAKIATMLSREIVYGSPETTDTIENYLKSITIPYPYINECSYAEIINKICEIAQLNVYADSDGLPVFISARPKATSTEIADAIRIQPYAMIGELSKTVLVKNKISNVFISKNNVSASWKELGNRRIENFTRDYKNSTEPTMTNVLSNGSRNPDITIFANDLQKGTTNWFYSIVKYDFNLPAESNLTVNEFQAIDRWTYWSGNDGTEYNAELPIINLSSKVVSDSQTDADVISKWADMSGSTPINIKSDVQNSDMQIRFNSNNTITVYSLMLIYIRGSSYTTYYGIHDISIKIKDYQSEFDESLTNYSFSIEGNELLQSTTTANLIKSNILADYADGVSDAKATLFCCDYYDSSNNKVKDWANGEIINAGDVVYFDGDLTPGGNQIYWRVVSRTFKCSGTPTIELVLMELK